MTCWSSLTVKKEPVATRKIIMAMKPTRAKIPLFILAISFQLSGLLAKVEEWERGISGVSVDDDFAFDVREDFLHALKVEALTSDRWGLFVFAVESEKAIRVTSGFVDSLGRLPFCSCDLLVGFSFGAWDLFIVFAAGDIDHPISLLLGLVDLVEGGLHGSWRVDVLELNLGDAEA